jgi:Dienelactone hydrolase family
MSIRHRHFPDGSVIRRIDLFQLPALRAGLGKGEAREITPTRRVGRSEAWHRNVRCFLVFPEVKEKAAAVIVVHEIFGLTEWVRSVAEQLAGGGYIAVAFACGMRKPR